MDPTREWCNQIINPIIDLLITAKKIGCLLFVLQNMVNASSQLVTEWGKMGSIS